MSGYDGIPPGPPSNSVSPTVRARDTDTDPTVASGTRKRQTADDLPAGSAEVTNVSSPQSVKGGNLVDKAKRQASGAASVGLDAVSSGAWTYPLYVSLAMYSES